MQRLPALPNVRQLPLALWMPATLVWQTFGGSFRS